MVNRKQRLRQALLLVAAQVCFGATVPLCALVRGAQETDEARLSFDWFARTYKARAAELERRFANMRIHGAIDTWDAVGDVEFRIRDDTWLRVVTSDAEDLAGRPHLPRRSGYVARYGRDYTFRLERTSPETPFRIIDVSILRHVSEAGKENLKGEKELRIGQFVRAPIAMYGKLIREWLEDEAFQVRSIRRLGGKEEDVVVEFALRFPVMSEFESGRLILIPRYRWALREYELRFVMDSGERRIRAAEGVRMSYESMSARRNAFPDRIAIYKLDRDTGEGTTYTLVTKSVEFGTVKPQELTLSAFQVADVTRPSVKGPDYTPVLVGLFVLLAAMYVVYVIRARRQRKS